MSNKLFENPTEERPHPAGMGGVQRLYEFPNGYTASVIRFAYSYGGDRGLWELAVIHTDRLCYDTPVTNDVEGCLSEDEVEALLEQVAALPERDAPPPPRRSAAELLADLEAFRNEQRAQEA